MTVIKARETLLYFTIVILSLFLLVGCSSGSSSSPEDNGTDNSKEKTGETTVPQSGGTLTIGYAEEPDTLDIHKSSMSAASTITAHLGGNLITINPETNELEPYLAEKYEVSEDGKTITFTLRDDVVFTDGTPLTAQVYKDTFDRILDPETGAVTVTSLVGGLKSAKAPDDKTLIIELEEPSAPFLHNLAVAGYLQPLSMAAIEEFGDDYGRNPVGSGPYMFEEWETGQSITLVRNEDFAWPESYYENQGKAYPDELVYKFIPDAQTMLAALDSGSIDFAVNVPAKDVKKYQDNDEFTVFDKDRQGLGLFVEMNLENDILSDVNVRKAMNMAIDKDAIIKAVLSGAGTPAYGPISSTIFGYDPNVENYGHKLNKDEAINLLESSGWEQNSDGFMEKDGEKLAFELSSSDSYSQAAQMVQGMLKGIGIEVNIQSMEIATLVEQVTEGDYELSFLAYTYDDPDILYLLFHSTQIGGMNHTRVQNPELDELLEKGRITLDTEERAEVYAEVQKIVVEEAYYVPIYADKIFYIANNRVNNIKFLNASPLLHDTWVEQQ